MQDESRKENQIYNGRKVVVKQRTGDDCFICSVATVTGRDYELIPKLDFSLNERDRYNKVVSELYNIGLKIVYVEEKPKTGIVVICFGLADNIFYHARPILDYKECYINEDESIIENFPPKIIVNRYYFKVLKMSRKRELTEAEKFYIEKNKDKSIDELVKATGQPRKLVEEYLSSLHKDFKLPKAKDFFIKEKSRYVAITEAASQMGDEYKRNFEPPKQRKGVFEIPRQ